MLLLLVVPAWAFVVVSAALFGLMVVLGLTLRTERRWLEEQQQRRERDELTRGEGTS
jgi:hypothetical protein